MPKRQQRKQQSRRRQSKLADKKINTLIEKRIEEIAKKEDRKNLKYFVEAQAFPANFASQSYIGTSIHQLHTDISPLVNTNVTSNANSIDYWPLTNFRMKYKYADRQGSPLPTNAENEDCSFRIRQVQAFLSFYNENNEPYQVCAALIGIPNSNPATAADSSALTGASNRLRPTRAMLCKNNWKFAPTSSGMFKDFFVNYHAGEEDKTGLKTIHHILDRKTVTVPGSGGVSGELAQLSNPKKVVKMSLSKLYKNPKKVSANYLSISGQDPSGAEKIMDDYNIYLCVTTNCANASSLIGMQAVGGVKFSLSSSTAPVIHPADPL